MKQTIRLTVDVIVDGPVRTAPNLSLDLYAYDALMRFCEGDTNVDINLIKATMLEGEQK